MNNFQKLTVLDQAIVTAKPDLELIINETIVPLKTPDCKQLRCFDCINWPNDSILIALGYSSGRTLLTKYDGSRSESGLIYLSDISPKVSRACVDVAFCPFNPSLLATGLDKARNDFGLTLC